MCVYTHRVVSERSCVRAGAIEYYGDIGHNLYALVSEMKILDKQRSTQKQMKCSFLYYFVGIERNERSERECE
jgi:hypothetical protein